MAVRNIEDIVNRQINRWNSITQALHYNPGKPGVERGGAKTASITSHPVICISRELGSGAREIAHAISERLGYELFGSQIIDEIAKDLHVQRRLIDTLDERHQNELELMLASFMQGREIEHQEYLASLMRVVQTMALKGGIVLLGRGGSFILGERAALNVQVTAPIENRIQRLMHYENLAEPAARQMILASDRQREWFARKCFHKDIHDPANFDLAINTNRIPPGEGATVVFAALEARGFSLDTLALPVASH